jgi:hypothetical protein
MKTRAAALLIAMIAAAAPAFACAPAPHNGERVDIVDESAVIQWDPATKTEHFIRRATFKGTARDFGFLVPTPATPALSEVDDAIFTALEAKTARKTVQKTTKKLDWTPFVMLLLGGFAKRETATARLPVEVLSVQKLAGYEAAVLDATDANALRDWLASHEYATTPDLTEWLDAYVKQGWKITAFKIDKSRAGDAAQSAAVKMTFTTDRPFFPYREPASQRASLPYDALRSLRIFFLGPERVAATIGANTFWPGVVTWSDRIDAAPGLTIAPNTRLTALTDTSSLRPGTDDLFFTRAATQSAYAPPPWVDETVEKTHVPLDVIVLGLVFIVFIVRMTSRG